MTILPRWLDRLLNTPCMILLGALPGLGLALYALASWPLLSTGLIAGWCGAWALLPANQTETAK
jgi:hypothetical protein